MAGDGVDAERGYVRAVFELMGRMVRETEALEEEMRGKGRDAALEAAIRERGKRYLAELESLVPPASLAEFHAEYVARAREDAERPVQRTERSGRRLTRDGQYERQEQHLELLRVLFAVATDEDVAAAGLPAEHRRRFVVEEPGAPQERLIMVGRDEQDWREKLRVEMERRGMPERDIEEALRRIEGMRDEE